MPYGYNPIPNINQYYNIKEEQDMQQPIITNTGVVQAPVPVVTDSAYLAPIQQAFNTSYSQGLNDKVLMDDIEFRRQMLQEQQAMKYEMAMQEQKEARQRALDLAQAYQEALMMGIKASQGY